MSTDWQPSASLAVIRARAMLLQNVRAFMSERNILEVETPVLANFGVSDPAIHSFVTQFSNPGKKNPQTLYLQTSPEYAMKRLLAAGSGPVYQIAKVFRDDEAGRLHNPEFTLLEWYRTGFDHHQLMDEIDDLLIALGGKSSVRYEYCELFMGHVGVDPITATDSELQEVARAAGLNDSLLERPVLLDFLFNRLVTPVLGQSQPAFVVHYPACQCALARLNPEDPSVAERFELFIHGIEIANGFHELADATEQRQRFLNDIERRKRSNNKIFPIDEHFLAALSAGLPDCAGVALGIDRLLMCLLKLDSIDQVLAFPVDRA